MEPVAVLMNEHRLIERVLDAAEAAAGQLARGGTIRAGFFADAVAFLTGYADRRHHHKEEDLLFPALVRAGLPGHDGPVGVMLTEHVRGRELIGRIRLAAEDLEAGRPAAGVQLAAATRAYVALLRDHIAKEDQVLFPMAGHLLGGDAARALALEFTRAATEEAAGDAHDRFPELAAALAEEAAAWNLA